MDDDWACAAPVDAHPNTLQPTFLLCPPVHVTAMKGKVPASYCDAAPCHGKQSYTETRPSTKNHLQ